MAENKTRPTAESVQAFLDGVENKRRREDGLALLHMMQEATGEEPVMWGPSIIGFGKYHYTYESGREGDSPVIAFSPRKASLTLYIDMDFDGYDALMDKLGKHTTSKACLYISKLADVDMDVLRKVIHKSVEHTRKTNPS